MLFSIFSCLWTETPKTFLEEIIKYKLLNGAEILKGNEVAKAL